MALDANFRLKQKDRGFKPGGTLGPGWSYFVEPESLARELKRVGGAKQAREKGTCESSFAAIERANSRSNDGFLVTGVVAAIDSRHGILLPNAVADLQKGERCVDILSLIFITTNSTLFRYVNSDFVYISSIKNRNLRHLMLSYDIICQWKINLESRRKDFPPELTTHLSRIQTSFGIPKFHLPAHGPKCWSLFSLNFLPGWARVDGEGIERFWSSTNPVATSTREMGTGARHDFLDDQWGSSNFRKVMGLGSSLAGKLRKAVTGRIRRCQELAELSSAFSDEMLAEWKKRIDDWNLDPISNSDPYQPLGQGK